MSSADVSAEMSIRVFGYCQATPAEVATLIHSGRDREVVRFGGNFVVVAERAQDVWIITSAYGVVAYFYSHGPTWFSHGPTVRTVLRDGAIEWRWNAEAVADLLTLEHLTGCSSLHASVERTPAASVLHWEGDPALGCHLVRDP